jgi:hypothetical protein
MESKKRQQEVKITHFDLKQSLQKVSDGAAGISFMK